MQVLVAQEICDNGIDDDNDTLIDLNDEDCHCQVTTFASLIANPSFEDMDCCPDDKSQLFCASDWIQASTPTSDLVHLCGWTGVREYPPPLPFPHGNGVLGFRNGRVSSNDTLDAQWKEYAGSCLLSPLIKDSTYQFEFDIGFVDAKISPPITVTLFGTTSCDHLPFGIGDEAFGCPTNSPVWVKLGEVLVDGVGNNTWRKAFIKFTPDEDIRAIAIGPDCNPIISSNVIYYYFDNLLLTDLASFDLRVREIFHPCDSNFTLAVPESSKFQYQWYLSGVALLGETFAQLQRNYGEGRYQVRILSGESCRVSASFEYIIPVFYSADTVIICKGDAYSFGEVDLETGGYYIDTFLTINNCDSIASILLEVIGESSDTIAVTIAPGEILELGGNAYDEEGEYALSVESSLGCDSLLLLQLSYYNVYIPNTFSPNGDGLNDLFYLSGATDKVVTYDMSIYDRWGGLVHQGDEWDGKDLSSDVFIYIIQVEFINGESNIFRGSVTLLR